MQVKVTDHPERLLDVSHIADDRVVFSFHFYDDETFTDGVHSLLPPNIPHGVDMNRKANEWPDMFRQFRAAATSRRLIPFLTEFGGNQDWTFNTSLRPEIYHHTQIRAVMDLEFQQIEANVLNAAYWDYELYNTAEHRDNWNEENASLLGPNRTPRNLDIVARPYPLRSSAEPTFLYFNMETKYGVLILKGPVVDAPTVIYVPGKVHYGNQFAVRATSGELQWDSEQQLLYWWPDKYRIDNHDIIFPAEGVNEFALPQDATE